MYNFREGELVLRSATNGLVYPPESLVNDHLAHNLFTLAEYGINFPGVASRVVTAGQQKQSYSVTHWVSGLNMHHEMAAVPLDVTQATICSMLDYYEAMSGDFSDRLWLADLSLRQCIFGRALDDTAVDEGLPVVNFVDFDPLFNNMRGVIDSPLYHRPAFRGLRGLDDDFWALKQNYPDQNFDSIAKRLLALAQKIGYVADVGSAFYHLNPELRPDHLASPKNS